MSDIEEVKSFEELLAPLFKRTPWYRRALRKIRWKLEDALESPKTLYRATKKFIQRGRRGWADEDVWNLDHYLSGVLAEALRHLADTTQCYPPEYGDFDSWRTTLLAMAGAFEEYHGREPGGCSKLTAGDWDCMGRIFTGLWD